MRVLVAGGGKVGTALARMLLAGGHDAVVLDDRPDVVERASRDLGTEVVRSGCPTEPRALEAAGIRRMDVVAAVTATDEHNLVIAALSKLYFDVPRTVARIVDPARGWMYVPALGVDAALNQAELIAQVVVDEMSSARGVPPALPPAGH